jgi:hypothetical protein
MAKIGFGRRVVRVVGGAIGFGVGVVGVVLRVL